MLSEDDFVFSADGEDENELIEWAEDNLLMDPHCTGFESATSDDLSYDNASPDSGGISSSSGNGKASSPRSARAPTSEAERALDKEGEAAASMDREMTASPQGVEESLDVKDLLPFLFTQHREDRKEIASPPADAADAIEAAATHGPLLVTIATPNILPWAEAAAGALGTLSSSTCSGGDDGAFRVVFPSRDLCAPLAEGSGWGVRQSSPFGPSAPRDGKNEKQSNIIKEVESDDGNYDILSAILSSASAAKDVGLGPPCASKSSAVWLKTIFNLLRASESRGAGRLVGGAGGGPAMLRWSPDGKHVGVHRDVGEVLGGGKLFQTTSQKSMRRTLVRHGFTRVPQFALIQPPAAPRLHRDSVESLAAYAWFGAPALRAGMCWSAFSACVAAAKAQKQRAEAHAGDCRGFGGGAAALKKKLRVG